MPHDEPSPNVEGKRQRRRRRRLKFEPKRWLKSCVRIFFKPIRRASARQAVLTLIIYCIIISLGTYYTQLLDDADAQDVYFATTYSRPFQCQVISLKRDMQLQSKVAPASQLLGDGVDIQIPLHSRSSICPEVCNRGKHGAIIPYYCYHSDVQMSERGGVSKLLALDSNCTSNCIQTGIITHRILTKKYSFEKGYYKRETTLLSEIQADLKRIEENERIKEEEIEKKKMEEEESLKKKQEEEKKRKDKIASGGRRFLKKIKKNAINRRTNNNKREDELEKAGAASQNRDSYAKLLYNDGMDDQYGLARKKPGTIGTCFINQIPYYHPACVNDRREKKKAINIVSNHTNSMNSTNRTLFATPLFSGGGGYSGGRLLLTSEEREEIEKKELLDRINKNSHFSYCPEGEDPCQWVSVTWEIPLLTRPLSTLLIVLLTIFWCIFAGLFWLWLPTIVRSTTRKIQLCVQNFKNKTELYKAQNQMNQTFYGKQKQICFIRLKNTGEIMMFCCMKCRRKILLCGAKIGLVDPKLIPSILGFHSNDSDSDDSDFDAAEETRKLEQLKKQKLWDQLVHAVTKSIKRNKNDINLSRMNITKLPNVMKRGHELFAEVNLSENKIKKIEITSPLLTLSNLLHLFLMDNSLLSLPNMTSLSSLVLLDVDGNDLGRGTLDDCILPKSLKKLYMNKNSISIFPECLLDLSSLEWLYLAHNQLTDLSEALPKPIKNEKNDDGGHSYCCGLSNSLKRFVLSHNNINQMPHHLGSLSRLEELWLTQNRIITLPDTICTLKHLKILIVNDNHLKELPKQVGTLPSLIELNVSTNHLVILPESIVHLKVIEKLNFSNNEITNLPFWVTNLKTVKYLDYTQNSIPVDNAHETIKNLKKTNPYIVEANFF